MILLMFFVSWLGPKYFVLLVVGLISYYLFKFYKNVNRYPKGPFPLPFIGNAHQITPYHLHEDFERFSKDYGDVFTIFIFGQPLVVLMRSEAIREAIVVKGDNFVNRTGEFPEDVFQVVENGGIIFSSGNNWREQRRNALHILRDFGVGRNLMEEQVHTQLEEFMNNIKNLKDKERVDLNTPIQIVVSNVINKLLFGYSYPHNNSDRLVSYALTINNLFSEMFKSMLILACQIAPVVKKIPFIYQRAVGKHVDKMNWCLDFVKEDVKNCLKDYSKDDEPNCFAQAYYQKMDNNEYLNMENLYNVCADFFMAGMETTTHTLRWAMLYLAADPDMQEKLRAEIEQVCGKRLPSLKDKPKMPYTNAFLTELQRASNLIPFNLQRKNTEETAIQGKTIPAGTCVVPQIHSIMSDPKLFPEPEKVKPERFLNKDGSFNTDLVGNVVPFGLGKRQCAGESLAKAELFLGVTTFFQKYRVSVADGQEINLEPNYGTALCPKPHLYKLEELN